MFKFLGQLYPTSNDAQRQIVISILSGLIIFLIFYFLQPFNMNRLSQADQLKFSVVYGVVTLSVLLVVTVLIPKIFPSIFIEARWNVGKEILFTLLVVLCIALGNLIANHFLVDVPIRLVNFLKMVIGTAFIGVLPITLSIALKQKILLERYKNQSETLNTSIQEARKIEEVVTETITPQTIKLVGDNHAETLELAPENLWFLGSADNYVTIVYKKAEALQSVLFRTTLKKMEMALGNSNTIVRCHKGFIVNLTKVENVEASAQGLKLALVGSKERVSVGKTFTEMIKKKLENA